MPDDDAEDCIVRPCFIVVISDADVDVGWIAVQHIWDAGEAVAVDQQCAVAHTDEFLGDQGMMVGIKGKSRLQSAE